MTDDEFMKNILSAAHLACIISYLKELSITNTVGDLGIVHQLIHLAAGTEGPCVNISEIREEFKTLLLLS
ncbi:hypothetical protein DXN05_03465 [Deminuibacter soli]|uniref:Uncharacterized protein n=2 Tax=Deminuibacter soli TaxID=2291815 RepID=A0A3E1NQ44_9BACT|nr:hypothetical protein DXN05_03465 [Deminuibacter soli]